MQYTVFNMMQSYVKNAGKNFITYLEKGVYLYGYLVHI